MDAKLDTDGTLVHVNAARAAEKLARFMVRVKGGVLGLSF